MLLPKPVRPGGPPIWIGSWGSDAGLRRVARLGDGWLGTSFIPEHADVFLEPLQRGLEKSGRTMADIDIQVGGSFELGDDVERMIEARKPAMAFTLGGMGSAKTNFYNDADGKDHWPIGSYIFMEKNPSWGNRVVGATDELHFAVPIDPSSLKRAPQSGINILPSHVHLALRKYLGLDDYANQAGFRISHILCGSTNAFSQIKGLDSCFPICGFRISDFTINLERPLNGTVVV